MILQNSVKPSWWPLIVRVSLFSLPVRILRALTLKEVWSFFLSIIIVIIVILFWFRDIMRERRFLGNFSLLTQLGFKVGILFFICREIIFFFRIFWTYFHYIFIFSGELGFTWPISFDKVNIFSIPLLNTLLLLTRGLTLTLSHNYKLLNNCFIISKFLNLTLILGATFILIQGYEYYCVDFLFRDSSYGSIFFLGTGFHGSHVFIGVLILVYCKYQSTLVTSKRTFFDLARWYWHFVDIIWIFLYCEFYWWNF